FSLTEGDPFPGLFRAAHSVVYFVLSLPRQQTIQPFVLHPGLIPLSLLLSLVFGMLFFPEHLLGLQVQAAELLRDGAGQVGAVFENSVRSHREVSLHCWWTPGRQEATRGNPYANGFTLPASTGQVIEELLC